MIVTFEDISNSGAAIEEWIWGIGGSAGVIVDDGSLSSIQSTYTTPDIYAINLTIKDVNGCSNTITKPNYINLHQGPIIDISADQTYKCLPPMLVNFSNLNIENNVTYQWDFGNGQHHTGPHPPSVNYDGQGVFDVRIIATHTITGCIDTLLLEEYINIGYRAQFGYSHQRTCIGSSIEFTDQSAFPADSLLWDFGDGNFSNDLNPAHSYDSATCYTVKLSRWVDGCLSTATIPQCIQIRNLPVIDYTSIDTLGCSLPYIANFNGFSPETVDWTWDFGDGESSSLQNPRHEYTSYGSFPVKLSIVNALGCKATIIKDTIEVKKVNTQITDERFFDCSPLSGHLSEQSTSISPINSWDWTLFNSNAQQVFSSTDSMPAFNLIDTGRYTVQLIVTNTFGCKDTSIADHLIGVGMPPVININATPSVSCSESAISFTDLSSAYSDEWLWNFGDGFSSTQQSPWHEFRDTGTFDITLAAYHLGCKAEKTFEDFVDIKPPRAIFALDRWCRFPYRVDFNEISIGADRFLWDFGVPNTEEDTSHMPDPSFIFPDTGLYSIKLIVFNDDTGCRDSTDFPIRITDPKADFELSTDSGCVPLTIDILNHSQSAAKYEWSVNDGIFSNPSIAAPELTFNSSGIYQNIKLVITDVNQCKDSMTLTSPIMVNEVFAAFDLDTSRRCAPAVIQLNDQSSDLLSDIVEWKWLLGDSLFNISDQHPILQIDSTHIFDIKLIATDDWGCQDSMTINNAIDVVLPIANFRADTLGCTSKSVQFVNESSGDALSYYWEFGDGNHSTEKAPTHDYSQEGLYTVCLTVSNPLGCDSTLCRADYLKIADPVAAFSIDTTYGNCPPLLVNLENNSINTSEYFWDFGDESGISALENPPHIYTIPGLYDVTLIAIANEKCQDTITLADLVHLEGPIGEFTYDVDSSCIPAEVNFIGTSIEDYDYIWDFGNGVIDSTLQVSTDSILHTYTEVGKYTPILILVNDENCHRYLELDTIHLGYLNPNFTSTLQNNCGPIESQFFNISSSSATIQTLSWTFPGTATEHSLELDPIVQFDSIGEYDVQLIIDNGFCKDSILKPGFIKVGALPVANFSISDTIACPNQVITFEDQSTLRASEIAKWDWNFGDQGYTDQANPTFSFPEEGEYVIQLKVASAINCTDSISKTITILPAPEATIAEHPEICINEKIQLSASILSDSTSFHWLDDPGLSCTDCLDPFVSIPVSTDFSLVIENEHGCQDTSTIQIEVGPHEAPTVVLSEDTTVCLNDPVQLFVSGGEDIYSYNWDTSSPGLSCYSACTNPIAIPNQSTTYSVTITNQYGCQNEDTVRVEIIDESQIFASEDRIICEGDTVHLSVNTGNDPIWLNPLWLNCSSCFDPIAQPDESCIYAVQVTTDQGCIIRDSVKVKVVDKASVNAGLDTIVCLNAPFQLQGQGEGQITWTPSASLDDAATLKPEAFPAASTTYTLEVEQGDCVLRDSVLITVIEKAEVITYDTTICEGESVELRVEGLADAFHWEDSPLLSANDIPNPIASPLQTTDFNLIGVLAGCRHDFATLRVNVNPAPDVKLPHTYRFLPEQEVQLYAEASDSAVYSYEWLDSPELSCNTCPNPRLSPTASGDYTLVVSDELTECKDTFNTQVVQLYSCPEDLISVPNIFTPNGDGDNDEFQLFPTPSIQSIEYIRIFNRWGALVFESTDIHATWDGTFRGELAPEGVYIYIIEAPCPTINGKLMKSGDITILR